MYIETKLQCELGLLALIGWWCVRAIDDIRGLRKEVKFHNQRFRRVSDVFLVESSRGHRIGEFVREIG